MGESLCVPVPVSQSHGTQRGGGEGKVGERDALGRGEGGGRERGSWELGRIKHALSVTRDEERGQWEVRNMERKWDVGRETRGCGGGGGGSGGRRNGGWYSGDRDTVGLVLSGTVTQQDWDTDGRP